MKGVVKREDKTESIELRGQFNFWQVESIFILSCACFVTGFVLWINFQSVLCSSMLIVIGLFLYILCNAILIYGKRNRQKRYLIGLFCVCNLLGIFVCFKFFIQEMVYLRVNMKFCIIIIGLFLFSFFGGCVLILCVKHFKGVTKLFIGNYIKVLWLAVFFIVLTFTNADVFDTWLRWDNYEYYRFMEQITFDALFEKVSAFRIAGHQTYALSLLVLILNYITEDTIITVYLLNFIYLFGGYICFMALIRKMFSGLSFTEIYLGSLLYALSPFFLGGMKCINLEFYLTFSLLLYLTASVYNFKALQFIAGFMLIFGKETGVVIMFVIMAVNVLWNNIDIKSLKKYIKTEDFYYALMILLLGLLWLVDYEGHQWLSTNVFPYETVDGSLFNNLGVSWIYIKDKLTVLFLSQFNWIFWIGIIVCLCAEIVNIIPTISYVNQANVLKNKAWMEMLGAAIGCLSVNLFMITYNHYRYIAPLIPILYLLFLRAVNILIGKVFIRCCIYCMVSLLLFVQCFRTIDPLMKHCFANLNIGESAVLCSPPNNVIEFGAPFTGEVQYNRQIADFDATLDNIIKCVDYSDDSCIVFSDEFSAKSANKNGYIGAVHCIGGYGYQYVKNPTRYVSWDKQNGKRYLSGSDKNEMNIVYLSSADQMIDLKQKYDRVIYIKMPWQDNLYKNEIEKMNLPETKVTYRGWELNAYTY